MTWRKGWEWEARRKGIWLWYMMGMVGRFILGAGGALLRKTVGSLGEPEAQSLGFSEEEGKRGLRKNILGFVYLVSSVQFSSVTQSCLTLCDPMNHSTPGLPVHHQLPEFTQTHVHRVGGVIQPSHPLLSPSPPAPNPSQHQGLFQKVNSLHEVGKVLEFQL